MKEEQDYFRDIADMRSMMERSSKFLSLSGLAGIMAGMYALSGAYIAYKFLYFSTDQIDYNTYQSGSLPSNLLKVIFLALVVLILAIGTAIFISWKKSNKMHEKFWNPTAKRWYEGGIFFVFSL